MSRITSTTTSRLPGLGLTLLPTLILGSHLDELLRNVLAGLLQDLDELLGLLAIPAFDQGDGAASLASPSWREYQAPPIISDMIVHTSSGLFHKTYAIVITTLVSMSVRFGDLLTVLIINFKFKILKFNNPHPAI